MTEDAFGAVPNFDLRKISVKDDAVMKNIEQLLQTLDGCLQTEGLNVPWLWI